MPIAVDAAPERVGAAGATGAALAGRGLTALAGRGLTTLAGRGVTALAGRGLTALAGRGSDGELIGGGPAIVALGAGAAAGAAAAGAGLAATVFTGAPTPGVVAAGGGSTGSIGPRFGGGVVGEAARPLANGGGSGARRSPPEEAMRGIVLRARRPDQPSRA